MQLKECRFICPGQNKRTREQVLDHSEYIVVEAWEAHPQGSLTRIRKLIHSSAAFYEQVSSGIGHFLSIVLRLRAYKVHPSGHYAHDREENFI